MRKNGTYLAFAVASILSLGLFGCGQSSIVGDWIFDDGRDAKTAVFDPDGSFAINGDGYITGTWAEYKVQPTVKIDGRTWNVYVYAQDESDPNDDVCFYVNGNDMYISMQRYDDLLKSYEYDINNGNDDGENAFEKLDANHAVRK